MGAIVNFTNRMWFSVVWTLIDNGKLAIRLAAIVVKTAYGRFTNVIDY